MDIILFEHGVLCGEIKSNNKKTLRLGSGRPCLQLTFLRVAFYIQRKSKAVNNVYVHPFCHQSSQALSSDQKNKIWIQVGEISFLKMVAGLSARERSSE